MNRTKYLVYLFFSTVCFANIESNGTIVYSYVPQASNLKVSSSTISSNSNIKHSLPIKFDILLDEKITEDDPRIKSIIYIAKQSPANFVNFSYTNPNALDLANRLIKIFATFGLNTQSPQLVNSSKLEDSKSVNVWINYVQPQLKNQASAITKQNSSSGK